ncbi:hypothetical protein EYC84_012110 [Monilinia fructicola]|uniref:Uncharacterized protein n=1 Tax=Monilinia fructicola TaxID=38448 RepID=A0A5M9J8H5_MONFR|nr:hypothetical protein EYC84_012110 [Monilinia fructicola]
MTMNVLDLGDVINIDGDNYFPKNFPELKAGEDAWTLKIEETLAHDSHLLYRAKWILDSHTEKAAREADEKQLLNELNALKKRAIEYEEMDGTGIEYDLPSFGTVDEDIEADSAYNDDDLTNSGSFFDDSLVPEKEVDMGMNDDDQLHINSAEGLNWMSRL